MFPSLFLSRFIALVAISGIQSAGGFRVKHCAGY
jgi:hypothetical protein